MTRYDVDIVRSRTLTPWPVLLIITGLLAVMAACDQPPQEPADLGTNVDTTAAAEDTSATLNALTVEERAAGWLLLFDGDSLNEWRGFRRDTVPAAWQAVDGAIYFDPAASDGGDIITKEQYSDFELQLDWRISEGGNSGIMYRVSEDADETWHTGPEMQVLDDERHPDAGNGPDRLAGAAYALYPPVHDVTRPAGEWNDTRIVVENGRVEHWLNDERVVEYVLGSEDWQQRVDSSKFADLPGFGQNERGHIAVQDHGDEVWYRNVKIRPLD